MAQWVSRRITDRKVKGSNPLGPSKLFGSCKFLSVLRILYSNINMQEKVVTALHDRRWTIDWLGHEWASQNRSKLSNWSASDLMQTQWVIMSGKLEDACLRSMNRKTCNRGVDPTLDAWTSSVTSQVDQKPDTWRQLIQEAFSAVMMVSKKSWEFRVIDNAFSLSFLSLNNDDTLLPLPKHLAWKHWPSFPFISLLSFCVFVSYSPFRKAVDSNVFTA